MSKTEASLPPALLGRPFHVREAAAEGVTWDRLRSASLDAPFVAVRTAERPQGVLALCAAYAPKMPSAEFFSHTTAAVIHGMWLPFEIEVREQLHVSVRRPARAPRDARVIGHHLIDRRNLVWTRLGFRVANPVETWCQLGTQLRLDDLVVAAESLLAKGRDVPRSTLESLRRAVYEESRPRRNLLARALQDVRIGVRSPQETRLRLLFIAAGLPEPEINGIIRAGDGSVIGECDLVYRDARVVIEYEGDYHRTDQDKWHRDVHRYELLQDEGWRVIRVTVRDLRDFPDQVVERVRRALAER